MENKIGSCMIKTFIDKYKKGKIDFEIPIQRESGVWKKEQKVLLIDSIFRGYDIPSIYICKDEMGVLKIIDGKQRLTSIIEFCENKFKLSDDIEDIRIGSETYEVKNKKFSELPEILKEIVEDRELSCKYLLNFTDEEIEEQFYRLNNGSCFSNPQKATVILGTEVAKEIKEISNMPFWERTALTNHQKKDGKIIETILKSLMLQIGWEYRNFGAKEVLRFSEEIRNDKNIIENLHILKSYFEILDTMIEDDDDKNKFLKPINIPILIYCIILCDEKECNENDFSEFINQWVESADKNIDYVNNCGQGSTNKEKVKRRCEIIEKSFSKFFN